MNDTLCTFDSCATGGEEWGGNSQVEANKRLMIGDPMEEDDAGLEVDW